MKPFPLKAVIIDDVPKAIHLLKLMIKELASDEVIVAGEAQNAEEGLRIVKELQPDLVFLDIEMPGKSGIDLASKFIEEGLNCGIIFTTAYNQYAIQAFRLAAIDYLLKPIQEKELLEAIQKGIDKANHLDTQKRLQALTKNLGMGEDKTLSIPSQNGYEFVSIKEIIYMEADGAYTHLYINGQKPLVVSKNLKYFEQALEQAPYFFRVHRTFLINLLHMTSYSKSDRGTIIMKDGRNIDLARNRRTEFLEVLEHLKSV